MALLAVTTAFVDAAAVQELASVHGLELSSLKLVTQATQLGETALPAGSFETIVSIGSSSGEHSLGYLGGLTRALKPGGHLVVAEPGASPASLQKGFTLAGLGAAAAGPAGTVTATKPSWETGARAAISLRKKPAVPATAAAWKLSADDEDEDDLIDDDQLLTEEDLSRPSPPEDCGPSTRKACKNCSCGRADGEAVKLTQAMLDRPTSGCGSCGLGDAYRCGGCPYRGLPSFEMGKKIELPEDFLVTDI